MKSNPKTAWNPERLDMRAFAQAGASLQAEEPLPGFERLHAEAVLEGQSSVGLVRWQARGEMRPGATGGEPTAWLHLQADTSVPLTCQRCLGPVDTPLASIRATGRSNVVWANLPDVSTTIKNK